MPKSTVRTVFLSLVFGTLLIGPSRGRSGYPDFAERSATLWGIAP